MSFTTLIFDDLSHYIRVNYVVLKIYYGGVIWIKVLKYEANTFQTRKDLEICLRAKLSESF